MRLKDELDVRTAEACRRAIALLRDQLGRALDEARKMEDKRGLRYVAELEPARNAARAAHSALKLVLVRKDDVMSVEELTDLSVAWVVVARVEAGEQLAEERALLPKETDERASARLEFVLDHLGPHEEDAERVGQGDALLGAEHRRDMRRAGHSEGGGLAPSAPRAFVVDDPPNAHRPGQHVARLAVVTPVGASADRADRFAHARLLPRLKALSPPAVAPGRVKARGPVTR
jgi:hypothetical protein